MRQFVSEQEPDARGCLSVEGKKAHYLSAVLRCAPGDMLYVRLPGGALQQMTVARIEAAPKRVLLQAAGAVVPSASGAHALPAAALPETELWLFAFAAKPAKMELIVRQAVECGVARIVPVAGEFCQASAVESARRKNAGQDSRWSRIVTEAREQSGSPVATEVLSCMALKEALALWQDCPSAVRDASLAIALYEQTAGTQPLHQAVAGCRARCGTIARCAVVVGAEGGISPAEIDYLKDNGVVPVHFLTNTLRCETAALYGLAAVQSALTESDVWQFNG